MHYLEFVRSLPCAFCATTHNIVAHHMKDWGYLSGTGLKAPDELTMPVCTNCHEQIHRQSQYMQTLQAESVIKTIYLAVQHGFSMKNG